MKKSTLICLVFFLGFVLFFLHGVVNLDPDFGWHLRMGQLILAKGIPKTDPFSYTMPSYPFVDHEWGSNVLIALLYPLVGMVGLSSIFAFLATFSLVFSYKQIPNLSRPFSLIPVLLAQSVLFAFSGIRTQIITWFFFSLLLVFIFNEKMWRRWRLALPFLFFIWANMHGGFFVGIVAIGACVGLKAFQKKTIDLVDFAVLLMSILATVVNPYGWRVWWEVWMQVSDNSLRWTIFEWLPAVFTLNGPLWVFIAFSTSILLRYRSKIGVVRSTFFLLFLLSGILSVRNIPLWILIGIPTTSVTLSLFFQEAISRQNGENRFRKASRAFFLIVLVFILLQMILDFRTMFASSKSFYPEQAVRYLQSHAFSGQVFSEYGWGGYLIWKFPEKKVFVDGRMPSWRWISPSPKESDYAFRDYLDVMNGRIPIKGVSKKYDIRIVLLAVTKKQENHFPQLTKLVSLIQQKLVFVSQKTGEHKTRDVELQLKEKEGWKEIYRDSVAVIYEKI